MKILAIFDMDGTLIQSPEPEEGKIIWKEKTGEDYPHKGWWGRRESLDMDVFEIKSYPNILSKLEQYKSMPDTEVIILTSRMEKLRPQVEKILSQNNIQVDKVILKRSSEDKGDVIMRYVRNNPDLKYIVVYDDFAGGMDHKIKEFTKIKDDLPEKIKYDIYYVEDDNTTLMESENKLLGIVREEISDFLKS